MILIECGPTTTIPTYSERHQVSKARLSPDALDYECDGNPIDTLLLTMFNGELLDRGCVGKPFLNMAWL
jgi:hypothetical protein